MIEMYRLNRLMGLPQTEVAQRFGVSQPTVSKAVTKVEHWQRSQFREEVSLFRTRMTLRLEHLYAEAMQTWAMSKTPLVVTTTREERGNQRQASNQESPQATTVITTRDTPQCGNPAFLRIAMDSLDQINNLWSGEIANSSRQSEYRVAGKTQIQVIEDKIGQLKELRENLVAKC